MRDKKKDTMRTALLLLILLYFGNTCFSQQPAQGFTPLKLTSFYGEAGIRGNLVEQRTERAKIKYKQSSSSLSGRLLLGTRGFILHPKVFLFSAGAEYNPNSGKDTYLSNPDFSNNMTLKRFSFQSILLSDMQANLATSANFFQSHVTRDHYRLVKRNGKNLGNKFNYYNKNLYFTLFFNKDRSDVLEYLSGRRYNYDQSSAGGSTENKIRKYIINSLSFLHDEFRLKEKEFQARNISNTIRLANRVQFRKNPQSSFSSTVTGSDQKGTNAYKRLQANEMLLLGLKKKFSLSGNYGFSGIERQSQGVYLHGIGAVLRHQLYESLRSTLSVEYNRTSQDAFVQNMIRPDIGFGYVKKIPARGRLDISYDISRAFQKIKSNDVTLTVQDEMHVLTDGQIALLNNPYVEIPGVVVTDATGTFVYQLNIDYILTPRNNYLEIQRIPGGMIANNSPVYVDYTAVQPGSYGYVMQTQSFTASIALFDRLVELYYRYRKQSNLELHQAEHLMLNYFTQNTYGVRTEYRFAKGGAEYTDYRSNIIPYRNVSCYLSVSGNYRNRILASLSGKTSSYLMTDNNVRQNFSDVSGMVTWNITKTIRSNFTADYLSQKIMDMDLEMVSARNEIIVELRKLYLSITLDFYKRIYLENEKFEFRGGYVQLTRRF